MSGGGSRTQTVTQSANQEPWSAAQPYLKDTLSEADSLFKSGVGGQVFQGSTVIPFSNQTQAGLDSMENFASAAAPAMAAPLASYTNQIATLDPIARGDFSNDPSFNHTLGRAQEDVRTGVDLSFSDAGRYGGAEHNQALAQEIGDMTNRAMLNRQQWASGALNQFGNSMGQAFQTGMAPAGAMRDVGSQYENLAANIKDDELRKFAEEQNRPWEQLGRMNAIAQGVGQMGGTNYGQSTVPQQSMWPQVAGNVAMGVGSGIGGGK